MGPSFLALVHGRVRSQALAPSGTENGAVDSLVYPCTCSHDVDDGSQLRRLACWPRCLAGLVRCKRSFSSTVVQTRSRSGRISRAALVMRADD